MKPAIKAPFVTHAIIEATSRCNYKCNFCSGRHMRQGDMSPELFSQTVNQLPNLQHLYLSGEGEGFLNKDFFMMSDLARSRGILLYHVTNGSALTDNNIELLLKFPFQEIYISTETLTPQVFHRIRGGDWLQVADGIKRLANARGSSKKPIIRLNFNALRSTLHEVPDAIKYSNEIGIDPPNIFTLQKKKDYSAKYNVETCNEMLDDEELKELQKLARSAHVPANFWVTLFEAGKGEPCPFLKRFIWVAHDGSLAPCCYIKDFKMGMGNALDENGIHLSFSSTAFASLCDELNNGVQPSHCKDCSIFEFHSWWLK